MHTFGHPAPLFSEERLTGMATEQPAESVEKTVTPTQESQERIARIEQEETATAHMTQVEKLNGRLQKFVEGIAKEKAAVPYAENGAPREQQKTEWEQSWDRWYESFRTQYNSTRETTEGSDQTDRLSTLLESYEKALEKARTDRAAAAIAASKTPDTRPARKEETAAQKPRAEAEKTLTPEQYTTWLQRLTDVANIAFRRLFETGEYRRFRLSAGSNDTLWKEQVARAEARAGGKNAKALALIFQRLDQELGDDMREGNQRNEGKLVRIDSLKFEKYTSLRAEALRSGLLS